MEYTNSYLYCGRSSMKITVAFFILILFLSGGVFSLEAQKPKSSTEGICLSLGATVIPLSLAIAINENDFFDYSLLISGIVIGPSVGHWYAGQYSRGWLTAGLRLGIGLSGAVTFGMLVLTPLMQNDIERVHLTPGWIVFYTTSCILTCSMIYDIASVPKSVRKYNESIGYSSNLQFVPDIDAKNKSCRLSVVYQF